MVYNKTIWRISTDMRENTSARYVVNARGHVGTRPVRICVRRSYSLARSHVDRN